MTGGYIRLFRSITENPIWTVLEPSVLKVMLAFLIRANWRASTWYDGGSEIEIPRGSFITSYAKIAEFCQLSIKQTRSAFAHLRKLHFAAYQRAGRCTMVTVLNYSTYQDSARDEGRIEGTARAAPGQDEGRMRAPIEESKKERRTKTCASDEALLSIDNPFFETTEPGALFPVETPKNSQPSKGMTPEQERWFDEWWGEYWRRVAKKAAREAFARHVRTAAQFEQVMSATRAQKPEMLSRPPDKRPYRATWLNGERWNDELEAPQRDESQYTRWNPPEAANG
jgi:hypothetical protein